MSDWGVVLSPGKVSCHILISSSLLSPWKPCLMCTPASIAHQKVASAATTARAKQARNAARLATTQACDVHHPPPYAAATDTALRAPHAASVDARSQVQSAAMTNRAPALAQISAVKRTTMGLSTVLLSVCQLSSCPSRRISWRSSSRTWPLSLSGVLDPNRAVQLC